MNTAPIFALSDQDGKVHTLAEYRGKKMLLYFYPKDMTEGWHDRIRRFPRCVEGSRRS